MASNAEKALGVLVVFGVGAGIGWLARGNAAGTGGAARHVVTGLAGVAQVRYAAAAPPTTGTPPPPGTSDTYTIPFTVALTTAAGAPVVGATITVAITGVSGASTTVTTGSAGTVTSSITASLVAGTSYTLTGTFTGQTISNNYYEPSSASQSFQAGAGIVTSLILTYTGG